jgi:hypothetical protein
MVYPCFAFEKYTSTSEYPFQAQGIIIYKKVNVNKRHVVSIMCNLNISVQETETHDDEGSTHL